MNGLAYIGKVIETAPIEGACIIAEEAGEVCKAALDHKYRGASVEDIKKEAAQTAAVCIRLLMELM